MSGAQQDGGEEHEANESAGATAEAAPELDVEAQADASPRIQARHAGRTAVGLVREHNEDNFVVADLSSGEVQPRDTVCDSVVGPGGLMFAVCDGMGGAAAGEVASQMAVDILVEAMRRDGVPEGRDALARRLVSAVEEAGRRIFDEAQQERSRRGMGTTATVAVLIDKVLFMAEVGDSRAYLLRQGQMQQLTKDQSLVNQLIEAGHLTEEEAEAFEHSNIILQALGTAESVQVDLTFVELRKGDRLMLCSDGLSGLVHGDSIRDALAEIEDPAQCTASLIEYAEGGGGHDNITVIVVDFEGDDLGTPGPDDSFGYMQYPLPLPEGQSAVFSDEETTASGQDFPAAARVDAASAADAPTDRGSVMWFVGGLLVLLLGLTVYAMSPSKEDHEAVHQSGEVVQPQVPEEEVMADSQQAEPVAVTVHTDVENATLLVNGEVHGPLSNKDSRSMELQPGAYRFEAQSEGGIAAVSVVTVRPEVPLDVFLQLPRGTTTAGGGPGEEEEASDDGPQEVSEGSDRGPAEAAEPAPSAAERAREERRREERRKRRREARARERAAREAQAATPQAPGATPQVAGPKPQAGPPPDKPRAPVAKPAEGIPDNPF